MISRNRAAMRSGKGGLTTKTTTKRRISIWMRETILKKRMMTKR